jgi:GNAT superfamily N-acetyltransferase
MIDRGVMRRTQDGARYWRGGQWADTPGTGAGRLLIREAGPEDASAIWDIYYSCSYMADWTGSPHDEAGLSALLANTDLPPGGSPEFSHLAVMQDKASGRLAGIAQYYSAWPEANCIWLGLMLIHPEFQKQGFGGEFVQAFIAESKRQAYARVGLGVALRNQPALKFWVKSGFDRIGKVTADGDAGPGSMATVGLYIIL